MAGGELRYVPVPAIIATRKIEEMARSQGDQVTWEQVATVRDAEIEELYTEYLNMDPLFAIARQIRAASLEELRALTDSDTQKAITYLESLQTMLRRQIANNVTLDKINPAIIERLSYLERLRVVDNLEDEVS